MSALKKMVEKLPNVPGPLNKNVLIFSTKLYLNPGPSEPQYALHLQTVQIQIGWLLKKPADLELHCLLFGI